MVHPFDPRLNPGKKSLPRDFAVRRVAFGGKTAAYESGQRPRRRQAQLDEPEPVVGEEAHRIGPHLDDARGEFERLLVDVDLHPDDVAARKSQIRPDARAADRHVTQEHDMRRFDALDAELCLFFDGDSAAVARAAYGRDV